MLPTDLLIHRWSGDSVIPKQLPLNSKHQDIAQILIDLFQTYVGQPQQILDRQLQELEGDTPDYRMKRGLAHLLKSAYSTFEVVSPLDPQQLRRRVFTMAAQNVPSVQRAGQVLTELADQLTQEQRYTVHPDQIRQGLYADLAENKLLTTFDAPTAAALLHRYNLSQVQGVFYKASQVQIHAYRNDPGEYKLLFRYLKLFQLMAYIEGDADHGFTITIDGPASLFKSSTRYGVDLAKLIPALLHVTKWSLTATLQIRDQNQHTVQIRPFNLDHTCGLVSHYPPGKPYDSMVEQSFVERWQSTATEWQLEREVDLIPIPGSVMIPDFRLVHPSGQTVLLEIIGYWRPEYLRKKFSQVRQSGCNHLILAISERLNLEKAGINLQDITAPIVWFKKDLRPSAVLAVLAEYVQ